MIGAHLSKVSVPFWLMLPNHKYLQCFRRSRRFLIVSDDQNID
jgi:hypothetical protein